jgi:hypothetical protein
MLLVTIHEPSPAFGHENNMKISDMLVPTRSLFGWKLRIGLYELGNHSAACRVGHPEVTIKEETPQPIGAPRGVFWLDMGE